MSADVYRSKHIDTVKTTGTALEDIVGRRRNFDFILASWRLASLKFFIQSSAQRPRRNTTQFTDTKPQSLKSSPCNITTGPKGITVRPKHLAETPCSRHGIRLERPHPLAQPAPPAKAPQPARRRQPAHPRARQPGAARGAARRRVYYARQGSWAARSSPAAERSHR